MKNILIVDRDLGFVFWLGQILDAAGYVAIPAKGIAEAAEIVAMLRLQIDVLVAAPTERGLRDFVEKLRFNSPDLHVVNLDSEEGPAIVRSSEGVWKRKRDEAAKAEWLELIHSLNGDCVASASRG